MVFERVVVRMQELSQGKKTQYRSEQTNKQMHICTHSLTHSLTHARTYALTNTSLSPYFSTCGACPDPLFQDAKKVPVPPQHNYPPPPPSPLCLTLFDTALTLWTKISGKGTFNRIGSSSCRRWGHTMTSDRVRVFVLRGDTAWGRTGAVALIKSALHSGIFQAVISSSTCSKGCRKYIATSYPMPCPSQLHSFINFYLWSSQ